LTTSDIVKGRRGSRIGVKSRGARLRRRKRRMVEMAMMKMGRRLVLHVNVSGR
jgi:hypothetical protein